MSASPFSFTSRISEKIASIHIPSISATSSFISSVLSPTSPERSGMLTEPSLEQENQLSSALKRITNASKQLLLGLIDVDDLSDEQISLLYTNLVKEFFHTCDVFEKHQIDVSDVKSFPDDLRVALETVIEQISSNDDNDDGVDSSIDINGEEINDLITKLLIILKEKHKSFLSTFAPASNGFKSEPSSKGSSLQHSRASTPLPRGSTKHIQKLYLQVRSEVKRTKVAEPVTFDYIQQLFQGRFHLNWDAVDGIETSDLPKVYIRDTQSQVFYELEELEDVEDGALLKLHADESVLRQLFPSRSSSPVEDKNFQLPESRPISVSTTTSRCSAQISSTMNDIRHLKSDLSELRLTYSKFVGDFSESLTTLRTHFSSTLPTVAALSDTMSLRQQLEPIKAEMQSLSDSLSSRLSDLADITDTLRLDILQRYTIPPPSKLDFINTESVELKSIVTALNNLLECHDTKWKSLWESELSNVVTEQNSIDSSTTLVESATSQLAQLTTVISQLSRIVELSHTNPDILPKKPQFTPQFHYPDSESESEFLGGENGEGLHEGLPTVLQELQNISIDSERRMKSIKQTEKLRAWERQNKKDEFEEQIQNALKGGLRRSADGGVEELERRRQEKEKEILKSLMSKK